MLNQIIIGSSLLYHLFLSLCTRIFFRFLENFTQNGNFMFYSVFRISPTGRVRAHVLILSYIVNYTSNPLGYSTIDSHVFISIFILDETMLTFLKKKSKINHFNATNTGLKRNSHPRVQIVLFYD